MSDRTQTTTPEQQAHWEKGQQIVDALGALRDELTINLPDLGEPMDIGRFEKVKSLPGRLNMQVVALREFLADSHLPGENKEPTHA